MALRFGDRVLETSSSTGTGAFTLTAAVTGHQRFSAVCSVADTCYYSIFAVDANGNPSGDWETGLGTYSGTNTLTRTSVAQSSNSNSAVSFAAGTKYVMLTPTTGWISGLAGSPSGSITASGYTQTTARLLGRTTASTGAIEEISVLGGLSLSGGALTGPAYSFGLSIVSTPTASEVLLLHIAAEAFTIPANFATPDSKGACGTNPTASFAIDVQRQVNATGSFTTIGTITISTGGAFTFATASGTSKSIAVNDVLKFVAPSSADSTAANIAITIKGTRA